MARASKRPKPEQSSELALPAPPPKRAPKKAPLPALEKLQQQVDDIARRYDTPTPGFAMAPERVLDERTRLDDESLRHGGAKSEPFSRWLLAQRDRGDWIDDLVASARRDPGFPKVADPDAVRAYLGKKGITEADVFEQIDDAERHWRSC